MSNESIMDSTEEPEAPLARQPLIRDPDIFTEFAEIKAKLEEKYGEKATTAVIKCFAQVEEPRYERIEYEIPKMEAVPVWSLNELPRNRIIRRLDYADQLELSLRSNDVRNIFKANQSSKPRMKLEWVFKGDECRMQWMNRIVIRFEEENTEQSGSTSFCFKLDGESEMKRVNRSGNTFTVTNCADFSQKLEAMEVITNHIVAVGDFTFELHYVGTPKFDIFDSFIFKTTKTFAKVVIDTQRRQSTYFTHEQLRFLLEELEIEELVMVNVNWFYGDEEMEDYKLNQKSLTLVNCHLLGPSDILSSPQMEVIDVECILGDLDEFMELVNAWQRGTHLTNMRRMELTCGGDFADGVDMRIQEDGTLGLIETDDPSAPCFSGFIERFHDGKEAEVEINSVLVGRHHGKGGRSAGSFTFSVL